MGEEGRGLFELWARALEDQGMSPYGRWEELHPAIREAWAAVERHVLRSAP